jgi:CheY-like chemotaxis protein
MEVSGKGLLYLINDLLDVSKIAAGKFSIDEGEFNLESLLHEVKTIFYKRAEEAKLAFRVVSSAHYPQLLLGDGHRISQVLINLLGNAVKFTEQGHVTLTIKEDKQPHQQDQLCFTIEDEGIGMSPETLQQLFQPFEQAEHSISRRFGGTGLGLYISKQLTDLMGGEIKVSSILGQGSRFEVRLPLQLSKTKATQVTQQPNHSHSRYSGTVLIAEDAPELQMLERRILEPMGLTVFTANNGKIALDMVKQQSFDMILMDMQMPVMSGIEATIQLRKEGYNIPIIALTANVMPRHSEEFEEAGCNHFLEKPINRAELEQLLDHYLPQAALPQGEVSTLIDDELFELFLQRCRVLHDEMMTALSNQQWPQVRKAAHTLKGSGTSFGYPELTRLGATVCNALDANQPVEAEGAVEQLHDLLQQICDGEAIDS